MSWCRRFANNCKLPIEEQNLTPHLQTDEFISTKDQIFMLEQHEYYSEVFKALQRKAPLPKGHTFRKYKISQSDTGLLLLSTRIRDVQETQQPRKHIPLSLKSPLTKSLLWSLHHQYLHPVTNTLLAIVGETYHVSGLRNHLKGLSWRCPQCQRAYDRGTQQHHHFTLLVSTSSDRSSHDEVTPGNLSWSNRTPVYLYAFRRKLHT